MTLYCRDGNTTALRITVTQHSMACTQYTRRGRSRRLQHHPDRPEAWRSLTSVEQ
jgi:hypothetical protein